MKQVDKLLAKSFVGPFVVTFAIALFVLLMQILWLYLDDIAGKGLNFFLVMELLAYKCVGLVPLALPLAMLISSVMVLGGLAEHYELASFKSAGVSLLRIMRTLILFGAAAAVVSYLCADYVIPAANLQFGARMYDIQQKKPTLNMEPGVFNEDFNQFAIRLGGRDDDGRNIQDVLIYDHSKANTGELSQIVAESGEMFITEEGRFFVMRLFDGHQYVEQRPGGRSGRKTPFMRTSFASYTKLFDLSEFLLRRHQASLFATNRSMLSTWQLREGVDSIDQDLLIRKQTISNHLLSYLPEFPRDTIVHRTGWNDQPVEEEADTSAMFQDTAREETSLAEIVKRPAGAVPPPSARPPGPKQIRELSKSSKDFAADLQERRRLRREEAREHVLVTNAAPWPGVMTLLDSLPAPDQKRVWNRARSGIRSVTSQARSTMRILPSVREGRVKHIYDLHMKYSMAVVCFIFVFIGAPMGAIVRKGGFGYPILVSIIFFVIFIILTIFCRKLAESFVVSGAFAGWLPCLILFPISLWITNRAMNDTKAISFDGIVGLFRRLRAWAGSRVSKR